MKYAKKVMLTVNFVIVTAVLVLNYFYQKNGFDFTLKCICSSGFALLGLINLAYVFLKKAESKSFYILMAAGLVLAMLGDVLIGYDFIIGAATFALGHVCFVIAYCSLKKIAFVDVLISGVLFFSALLFLLFCPFLSFDEPVFKVVCIIYALIISLMLGKAAGNFICERNLFYGVMAVGSALFFFSDLMLVFDWFIGFWDWTSEACMGTYYPALSLLAVSMFIRATDKDKSRSGKI